VIINLDINIFDDIVIKNLETPGQVVGLKFEGTDLPLFKIAYWLNSEQKIVWLYQDEIRKKG